MASLDWNFESSGKCLNSNCDPDRKIIGYVDHSTSRWSERYNDCGSIRSSPININTTQITKKNKSNLEFHYKDQIKYTYTTFNNYTKHVPSDRNGGYFNVETVNNQRNYITINNDEYDLINFSLHEGLHAIDSVKGDYEILLEHRHVNNKDRRLFICIPVKLTGVSNHFLWGISSDFNVPSDSDPLDVKHTHSHSLEVNATRSNGSTQKGKITKRKKNSCVVLFNDKSTEDIPNNKISLISHEHNHSFPEKEEEFKINPPIIYAFPDNPSYYNYNGRRPWPPCDLVEYIVLKQSLPARTDNFTTLIRNGFVNKSRSIQGETSPNTNMAVSFYEMSDIIRSPITDKDRGNMGGGHGHHERSVLDIKDSDVVEGFTNPGNDKDVDNRERSIGQDVERFLQPKEADLEGIQKYGGGGDENDGFGEGIEKFGKIAGGGLRTIASNPALFLPIRIFSLFLAFLIALLLYGFTWKRVFKMARSLTLTFPSPFRGMHHFFIRMVSGD